MASLGDDPIPVYDLYGHPVRERGESFVHAERIIAGRFIGAHSHPALHQMLLVTKGGGEASFEDETHRFEAPSLMVIPMLMVHSFEFDSGVAGFVVTVSDSFLRSLVRRGLARRDLFRACKCMPMSDDIAAKYGAARAARQLCEEIVANQPYVELASEGLFLAFYARLLRGISVDLLNTAATVAMMRRRPQAHLVFRFKELVEQRYRSHWELPRYAEALGSSVRRLRTACQNIVGKSPSAMIGERLVTEAKRQLLHTSMSATEIAYLLGFSDPSHFSHFFTERVEESPSMFRRHGPDQCATIQPARGIHERKRPQAHTARMN
jgi:AraC family transcriptional regulator, transcriptional activator of pobA